MSPAEVERGVDALFGTVDYAGAIAEGLKRGETITMIGFGDFHLEDSRPVLRPGHVLHENVNDSTS